MKEKTIMDKKPFDSLDESVKEKLRNCKSEAEMQKVISDSGLQELSVDVLEGVSGGCNTCTPYCDDKQIKPPYPELYVDF